MKNNLRHGQVVSLYKSRDKKDIDLITTKKRQLKRYVRKDIIYYRAFYSEKFKKSFSGKKQIRQLYKNLRAMPFKFEKYNLFGNS